MELLEFQLKIDDFHQKQAEEAKRKRAELLQRRKADLLQRRKDALLQEAESRLIGSRINASGREFSDLDPQASVEVRRGSFPLRKLCPRGPKV